MTLSHALELLLLAGPAVASLFYFGIAARWLERWMGMPTPGDKGDLPPVTFFRPLKGGVPDLSSKLDVLAGAMRSGDQLLLGAAVGSPEAAMAEAWRANWPGLEIAVVRCEPGAGASNPKIAKLVQMAPLARHEHWIVSDSEAVTDADFLDPFRREWRQEGDVLTAGYRFSRVETWPQRLDAAAVLLGLWPGLAILRATHRVRLTLGACTGLRRGDLQAVGGWSAFAEDLAEDNRLGRALTAEGRTVRLSAQVVTLECDALSWRDYWRHQRRVAVTYRVANPMGFAGAFVTQGVTTSFLLACARPLELGTWVLAGVVFAARWLTARRAARTLGFSIPHLGPTVFVASLVETVCWGLSWGTGRVWWSGRWRGVDRGGRLVS